MFRINPSNIEFLRPFVYKDLIRVGNKADGGYVIPECVLENTKYCISFGIGYNHTFEFDVQNRVPSIKVIGFDHTVSSLYFLSKSLNAIIKLCLNRGTFLDLKIRTLRFLNFFNFWIKNPKNKHNKIKITSKNINEILNIFKHEDILLKIDIEGAEWESLPIVAKNIGNVNCLIIEFHDISSNFSNFKKLVCDLEENFNIAHAHINNFSDHNYGVIPDFIEVTFANKKYSHNNKKTNNLPILNLDFKTMPNKEDFEVVFSD